MGTYKETSVKKATFIGLWRLKMNLQVTLKGILLKTNLQVLLLKRTFSYFKGPDFEKEITVNLKRAGNKNATKAYFKGTVFFTRNYRLISKVSD